MPCRGGISFLVGGWGDLPTQRQGEIWPAKRQIILGKLRWRVPLPALRLGQCHSALMEPRGHGGQAAARAISCLQSGVWRGVKPTHVSGPVDSSLPSGPWATGDEGTMRLLPPLIEAWNLELLWSLKFGAWCLDMGASLGVGVWSLVLIHGLTPTR